MATVVMLVILRLSLGCHFLYEGVWKIKHADTFSAAPFLSEAKGPIAPLFYAMLPDLEGRQRLGVKQDANGKVELAAEKDDKGEVICDVKKDEKGEVVKTPRYKLSAYLDAWKDLKDRVIGQYRLDDDQAEKAESLYSLYAASVREYVAEHEDEITAHFMSRYRFKLQEAAGNDGVAHQQERDWKRERDLRKEMNTWLAQLDTIGKNYQSALWNLLDPDQKAKGPLSAGWNPLAWPRTEQINFAVTYGLTAIGLCLVLGFFTRLAALGGGVFMLFVVMTQPAWPGLYPPDPNVVGHALLVNKDFVEMVALFLLATTAAGRWGGLDWFGYHLLVRPFLDKRVNSKSSK